MKIVDNSHTIFRGNFNLFCVYLKSNYLTFLQMFVRASQFSFHLHTFCHTQETFFGIVFYSSSTSTVNFVFFCCRFSPLFFDSQNVFWSGFFATELCEMFFFNIFVETQQFLLYFSFLEMCAVSILFFVFLFLRSATPTHLHGGN